MSRFLPVSLSSAESPKARVPKLLASGLFIAGLVLAGLLPGDHARAATRVAPVSDPLTREECSACHMAFPPSLLPADSWKTIMGSLEHHFGESAALPADKADKIRAWLMDNASRDARWAGDAPPLRITGQGWWISQHRGQVSPAMFRRAGSPANCMACHPRGNEGDFEQ